MYGPPPECKKNWVGGEAVCENVSGFLGSRARWPSLAVSFISCVSSASIAWGSLSHPAGDGIPDPIGLRQLSCWSVAAAPDHDPGPSPSYFVNPVQSAQTTAEETKPCNSRPRRCRRSEPQWPSRPWHGARHLRPRRSCGCPSGSSLPPLRQPGTRWRSRN
jgi:hypothetical protein